MNPISSASAGVLSASAQFATAGISTVAAANGQGNLAAAIVGQAQAGVQLQAAANVEKVSDELTATLLDITV
jgi:hypothetical protein